MSTLSGARISVALVLLGLLLTPATVFAQKRRSDFAHAENLLQQNIMLTGLGQDLLKQFRIVNAYPDKSAGTFQVYLQQLRMDVPVYNKISVYTFRNDTLIYKNQDYIPRFSNGSAKSTGYFVDAAQAVRLAGSHFSIGLDKAPQLIKKEDDNKRFVYRVQGLGTDSTTSELVWLPVGEAGLVKLSWNVRIVSPDRRRDWFVRIDAATGDVLDENSLILSEHASPMCIENGSSGGNKFIQVSDQSPAAILPAIVPISVTSATYRVFPLYTESPNYAGRVLETDPWMKAGSGNNAVTLGWHYDNSASYSLTRGNNVWAQEDIAGTGATTGLTDVSSTPLPVLTFDKPLDFSVNPVDNNNLRAATNNLFYWNNIMHDVIYQYGFDEAAGNFQMNNIGRGGIENDYVHAFAEDGAGMSNATFATPPDGQNPTMRMFQWNSGVTTNLQVTGPAAAAGNYLAVEGGINLISQLTYTGSKSAGIYRVLDAGGSVLGCNTIVNTPTISGNIALIDRGGCNFSVKIKNAQAAGAIAVIMVNNVGGAPYVMTGFDASITIPSVMISMNDGNNLKNNLSGLTGIVSSQGLLKDGSLDNGIIAHEYTHGISNRLTGGAANAGCLANAEQMGEGWSDYVALMMTTNWATATSAAGATPRPIGTYALSQSAGGPGIRVYPYSTDMTVNPWTYGMMAGSTAGEPHTIGEIWCSALWDMTWNIIQLEGIDPDIYHGTGGNNIALQLVIAGMKYQPCSPGFIDARNAILKADSILYNYAHKCAIWSAFARRGMGKNASQGSSALFTDQVAATDLPDGLGVTKTSSRSSFANGDNVTYTIRAFCDCAPLSNISIVDTLASSLSYTSSSGGTLSGRVVQFTGQNFVPGETKVFTIQAKVAGSGPSSMTLINDTQDGATHAWTTSTFFGSNSWSSVTTRSHSTSHAWFAPDAPSQGEMILTSNSVVLDTLSTLSFWHYFDTDPGYDGGLVEISVAGGLWMDLGPYMNQNGYNSSLDRTSPNAGNRAAFTGSSGGEFINTVATLTGFAGQSVRIRFRSVSDVFAGGQGWWIDDILLQNEKGIVNSAFAYNGSTQLSANSAVGLFTSSTLPVSFLGFDVKLQGQDALLHWKVADELNVRKYIVERSTDGVDFSPVGEVPFNALVNGDKDYYFTDRSIAEGNNYYRVLEQDIDGGLNLSAIRLLRITGGRMTITIQPVPAANHQATVVIRYAGAGTFPAHIVNNVGQVVRKLGLQNGAATLNLDNLVSGVYYLKIELNDRHTEVRKLIIQ